MRASNQVQILSESLKLTCPFSGKNGVSKAYIAQASAPLTIVGESMRSTELTV